MENQLRFVNRFSNFLPYLNKHYPQSAAIFDQSKSSQSPPHCAICLTDLCGGDRYRKLLECGHCYHAHFIDVWFRSNSTCPLCRVRVPQVISLNENLYPLSVVLSNLISFVEDFYEKMCNPLNDELSSMLCGNVRRVG